MKSSKAALLALALTLSVNSTLAAPPHAVPVEVGGDAILDACGSLGRVHGLKVGGDGFLAVRDGPGSAYAMTDKLSENREVLMCDQRGEWIAVVYSDSSLGRCGATSPIAKRQPYRGPCKSGWVHGKWIELMAG
ncbi:hypothetical protein J5226_13280 [Lysobacter sp. K5869]|uniref:hypothetical protein n=1 Tax=Lysobacter sp. K5869 TaxID=2820808 RepID=UPI001C063C4B|nr:hypothetical protein [Lysobacter sp. K5869]QWP74665.1 hypothetical protein J5226_13280 [Lysobacter sp. K5869]